MKLIDKLSETLIKEITEKNSFDFLRNATKNDLFDLVWSSFFYGFIGACIIILGALVIINFLF